MGLQNRSEATSTPEKTLIAGPIYGSYESENDEGMQHLLWFHHKVWSAWFWMASWDVGVANQKPLSFPDSQIDFINTGVHHDCHVVVVVSNFFKCSPLERWSDSTGIYFLSNGLKPPTALLQYCFLLLGLVLLVATATTTCPAQVDGLSVHSSLAVLVKHGFRKGMDKSNKQIRDREVWFWCWRWRWRWWVRCGDESDTQNSKQKSVHTASLKFSHALTSSAHVTGTGCFDISINITLR